MDKTERFSTYKHNFAYGNNLLITKQFIVLCHSDGTKTFTDFHKYAKNPNRKIKQFNENGNNRFIFICKFLNYAFFTEGINSLSELTVDTGKHFLNAYGMHELPEDDEYVHRSKTTVEKCVKSILDFYINLTKDKKSGCKIRTEDLYKYITVRTKYGKVVKKIIPQFEVNYIANTKAPIYRDIPNKAFTILFDHIATNHKDLLGIVMHQAFAGLRPSEACNVRREDSNLGAGIRIQTVGGELRGVSIDLNNELNLRSDLLSVGGIKKERTARVPDIFLTAYKNAYDIYAEYMEGNRSRDKLISAITERDCYYKKIADSAFYHIEKYKKLKEKYEQEKENTNALITKITELENLLTEYKAEMKILHSDLSAYKSVIETYVYPEIANELLIKEGAIRKTETLLKDEILENNLITSTTNIKKASKMKSNVIKGLFDELDK